MEEPEDEIEAIIENGVMELYLGFFRLRESGQFRREYDTMGSIINMLTADREYLRKSQKIKI